MVAEITHIPPELLEARRAIDAIDEELITLLVKRFAVVEEVVRIKRATGLPARLQNRVDEVIERAERLAVEKGLPEGIAAALWRELVHQTIVHEDDNLGNDQG